MQNSRTAKALFLFGVGLLALPPVSEAMEFSYKGFASATFGTILSGEMQPYLNYTCPCYVGNYEYAGVYTGHGIEGNRESLLGLQGSVQLLSPLSATMQVVARASTEKVTVDWAYLTYQLNSEWSFQAGRKRLPLYYYSDSVYIGYSYPWVRTPTDVYGYEIFDYDGANVTYSHYFGDWLLTASLYGGRRSVGYDLMETNLYYGYQESEAWNKIIGGSIDFSNDIFGFRLISQHNKIDSYSYPPGLPAEQDYNRQPQNIIGTAFTIDYGGFLWRSEANTFWLPAGGDYNSYSYLAGGGYKYKKVTGMFTESWYYERRSTEDPEPTRQHTHSLSLRWDFKKFWDAKLQFDLFHPTGDAAFTGQSRVLTLSVNTVF